LVIEIVRSYTMDELWFAVLVNLKFKKLFLRRRYGKGINLKMWWEELWRKFEIIIKCAQLYEKSCYFSLKINNLKYANGYKIKIRFIIMFWQFYKTKNILNTYLCFVMRYIWNLPHTRANSLVLFILLYLLFNFIIL